VNTVLPLITSLNWNYQLSPGLQILRILAA
jgi:hypothetical protein